MKRIIIILIAIAVIVFAICKCSKGNDKSLSGIAIFPVSIETILQDPQDYEDRNTIIKGKVLRTMGIGRKSLFLLSDGTGEIWVASGQSSAPPEGSEVRVHGHTKQWFRAGSATMLVFEEKDGSKES